jgi:hypothetical protein
MKTSNLLLISLILLVAVSGCTINLDMGNNDQTDYSGSNQTMGQEDDEITGSAETETTDDFLDDINNFSETNDSMLTNLTEQEEIYYDAECFSLDDSYMEITTLEQDSETNAKEISLCSVNHDTMNGVNYKYYTFTLETPSRIYAMIDSFETGAWQVGIIGHGSKEGENGEPIIYTADLDAGTYIIYVMPINLLASSCTNEDCCFELNSSGICWWISGNPANGVFELSYTLTLSTSEIEHSIEEANETIIAENNSCAAFSAKTVDKTIIHDTPQTAYSSALCDELTDTFTSATYQYYTITLNHETNVKLTLNKPEGFWQIGINDYSWTDSESTGEESVVYEHLLPAGTYTAWVSVSNTAGIGGEDWTCREIVEDGTCYWTSGSPINGTYYIDYEVIFDAQ